MLLYVLTPMGCLPDLQLVQVGFAVAEAASPDQLVNTCVCLVHASVGHLKLKRACLITFRACCGRHFRVRLYYHDCDCEYIVAYILFAHTFIPVRLAAILPYKNEKSRCMLMFG